MKTYSYEIEQDSDAGNPRDEFDHLSTFYAVKNSRYITGGKKDVEITYREDLEAEITLFRKAGAVVVEFENYHAGTCYAVVERSQMKSEYLDHGYSMRKALYWARQCAKGETEEFNAWATGEVYGYTIKDDDGNHVDSCWGFYGYKYCEQEAESVIKWHLKNDKKEYQTLLKRLEAVS